MKCSDRYDVVRNTQIALFKESGVDPQDFNGLIDLFGPERLANYLELDYRELEVIPSSNPDFEVAGMLDRTNRIIYVSRAFPLEQQRLTGIHEIMHWMLHQDVGRDRLHRDRPISHLPRENSVLWYEWEATNVGCQYLMPEKLVKERFSLVFGLRVGEQIQFNEDVAFYLGRDIEDLRRMDYKDRATLLATTESYGRPIVPLYRQFRVSPTAMRIRLQELDLLAPDRWRGRPNLRVVR